MTLNNLSLQKVHHNSAMTCTALFALGVYTSNMGMGAVLFQISSLPYLGILVFRPSSTDLRSDRVHKPRARGGLRTHLKLKPMGV